MALAAEDGPLIASGIAELEVLDFAEALDVSAEIYDPSLLLGGVRTDAATDDLIPKSQRHGRSCHDYGVEFGVVESCGKYTYVGHYLYRALLESIQDALSFSLRGLSADYDAPRYLLCDLFGLFKESGKDEYAFAVSSYLGLEETSDDGDQVA